MENETTSNNTYSMSRDIIERLLYGLVTLVFYITPFLIPGIDMRQGLFLFFGDFILLFLGFIIFVKWSKKINHGAHSKSHRISY